MSEDTMAKNGAAEAPNQDEGKRFYLAQVKDAGGTITLKGGTRRVVFQGEILVIGRPSADQTLIVEEVRRVALRSQFLDELEGAVSVAGPANEFRFEPGDRQAQPIEMRLYYRLLSYLEPACRDADAVFPQLETIQGSLVWEPEQSIEANVLRARVTLTLDKLTEVVLGAVETITFGPAVLSFHPPQPAPQIMPKANSLVPCNPGIPNNGTGHFARELNVRFVGVSVIDPNLEQEIQKWINAACQVWWNNGGVRITPLGAIATSNYLGGVIAQGQEQDVFANIGNDPDRIDVYVVQELSDEPGGGITHNCGTSDAFVLLEFEKSKNNKYMLAHELGHVLGLRHPDMLAPNPTDPCKSYRAGSFCSIMVADNPNIPYNTQNNIGVVEEPTNLLMPDELKILINEPCNWQFPLDQHMFHMIRDFPYDDGTQPPQLQPPGMDWWSFSDVWNSDKKPDPYDDTYAKYSDGTLMFNTDYSPKHSEPLCTGQQNICVRLHRCESVTGPVNVDLYLADPGVSPGFQNLIPLKPLPNNRIIFNQAMGAGLLVPVVKSISWSWTDVQANHPGYPIHCCVFAIASSAQEPSPLPNPAMVTFNDVFPLLDNDIAQRNMNIQNCPPVKLKPLWVTLPWVQIANPFEKAAAARVDLNTALANDLVALEVEVNEQRVGNLPRDDLTRLPISDALGPDQRVVLRLRALVPAAPEDTTFSINLQFYVDDQLITGYRHVLRVAPLANAAVQVVDSLFGALWTVFLAFYSEPARDVAASVRRIVRRYAHEPERALSAVGRLYTKIAAIADSVDPDREPEGRVVRARLFELAGILIGGPNEEEPGPFVEQIRDLADRIQEPAGRLARRLAR